MTLEDLRETVQALVVALRAAGETVPARRLGEALALDAPQSEQLLEVRSAMVSTRLIWETAVSPNLRRLAASHLAAAKRLAIELE